MTSIPYAPGEVAFAAGFPSYSNLNKIKDLLNKKFGNLRSRQSIANMRYIAKKKLKRTCARKSVYHPKPIKEKETSFYVYIPPGKPIINGSDLFPIMDQTDTSLHDIAEVTGLDVESIRVLLGRGGIPNPFAASIQRYYEEMGVMV